MLQFIYQQNMPYFLNKNCLLLFLKKKANFQHEKLNLYIYDDGREKLWFYL
jgi:hypothetical protein